jgi:hypothetical protein
MNKLPEPETLLSAHHIADKPSQELDRLMLIVSLTDEIVLPWAAARAWKENYTVVVPLNGDSSSQIIDVCFMLRINYKDY